MSTLIFIDTNIWLDFYRVTGRQGDLSILDRIDSNRSSMITGTQVEMEFKKNRPQVILESYKQLKPPNWATLQLPAYLARSKQSSGLDTGRKRIEDQLNTLKDRTENIFKEPTRYDPVYKVAQRLFKQNSPYNLSRDKKARYTIRRLAWKRFILGYPPRKPQETSTGDAINWEWIVRCAHESGNDVVVVSRDSDFGVRFGNKLYLNDWLRQEFRDRVGRQRKIELTDRLAEAFKMASIPVTPEEEKAEEEFLEERKHVVRFGPIATALSSSTATGERSVSLEELLSWFAEVLVSQCKTPTRMLRKDRRKHLETRSPTNRKREESPFG